MLLHKLLRTKGLVAKYKVQSECLQRAVSESLRGVDVIPTEVDFVTIGCEASPSSERREEGPHYLSILQLPLFDMLRYIFSTFAATSASSEGLENRITTFRDEKESATVLMAVDLWLLYIQPWLLTDSKGSTGSDSDRKSLSNWRPYIASNLHFYTTLLSCFLSMNARVNLSGRSHYLSCLERVLAAFTFSHSALLHTVEDLLSAFKPWYLQQRHDTRSGRSVETGFRSPGRRASAASARWPTDANAELCALAFQHQSLFPDRSIDKLLSDGGICDFRSYSLESCAQIMFSLRAARNGVDDEARQANVVHTDILKYLDDWIDYVMSACGLIEPLPPPVSVPVSLSLSAEVDPSRGRQTWTNRVERCMNMLLAINPGANRQRFTKEAPGENRAAKTEQRKKDDLAKAISDECERLMMLRDLHNGKLTDYGRQQVLLGNERCKVAKSLASSLPLEGMLHHAERIPYCHYKDSLDLPVCSFEVSVLVDWTVRVSKSLNQRFQLPQDGRWLLWRWDQLLDILPDPTIPSEDRFWKETQLPLVVVATFLVVTAVISRWIGIGRLLVAALATIILMMSGYVAMVRMGWHLAWGRQVLVDPFPKVHMFYPNLAFLKKIFRINLRLLANKKVLLAAHFLISLLVVAYTSISLAFMVMVIATGSLLMVAFGLTL